MSTQAAFASIPKYKSGTVPATLDTSTTAPSNTTVIFSAGSSGTKVNQIRVVYLATTSADTVVNVWLKTSSTYTLWEPITVPAGTLSTTKTPISLDFYYDNLDIASGDSMEVSVTTAPGQSNLRVTALIADY